MDNFKPLSGVKVVSLALNVPGPIVADKLAQLGAEVIKIEPPTGDPLAIYSPAWYEFLNSRQKLVSCNLKTDQGREELFAILKNSDLLITAQRPAALERLGLNWSQLNRQFPQLSCIAIVGYAGDKANKAGHDLTYQAKLGMLSPPQMPKTLLADLAGAEKAVSMAMAALLNYQKTAAGSFIEVALEDSAKEFSLPLKYGATATGGMLSGVLPEYALYPTAKGWLAVAALEPHFKERLQQKLAITELTKQSLSQSLLQKTAAEWESWAKIEDIPLSAVH